MQTERTTVFFHVTRTLFPFDILIGVLVILSDEFILISIQAPSIIGMDNKKNLYKG